MSYQQLSPGQTYPETPINENMAALGQAFCFAWDKPNSTDLDVGFSGGVFNGATLAADVLACADDDENYVVAARADGTLSVAITTTNWNNTTTYGRVARVTFVGGALTVFADERFSVGGIFDHLPTAMAAADVSVADAGAYFTSTDTEGVLQEIGAALGALTGLTDVLTFKGVIDCSANPNYPAADAGDTYRVSVAGKIGGGSGVNVEAGDLLLCLADATASGTQAGVGASWSITQANIDGAVVGPASATANAIALYDGTTGKLLKDSTYTITSAGAALLDDANVAAQRATLGVEKIGIGVFLAGKPTASQLLLRYTFPVAVDFADDFASLSRGSASAAATAQTDYDVKKNGSSVGTIRYAATATTPTFITAGGAVSFAAGDVLAIVAPASPDATLADADFTLMGTRA